jgi:hypothetical protein
VGDILFIIDLHAGDSIFFAADTEHGYANDGPETCSYYVAALIMWPRVAARAT